MATNVYSAATAKGTARDGAVSAASSGDANTLANAMKKVDTAAADSATANAALQAANG